MFLIFNLINGLKNLYQYKTCKCQKQTYHFYVCHRKYNMFGLFKKKSEKEILMAEYKKLMEESFRLSTINRTESDQKAAEASALLEKIDLMS